ncbi:response regulator transcription factor [Amorphus orientalis]|uniref:DNA-binding NarL/FixJ family response regulator n=1 Tax=Amorphus orientalis TaxID=649198 RepID=A0AAE4AUT2_9HYPH|nr:DNA-binding response regulator [Amorphus orientalis]MDQ0317788.1 DNA-binding NarL/FixJ family response regulator [Amorphus orientalis]
MMLNQTRDIVLVVDDAPETLSMLIDTLEEAGLTVIVARDGITALTLARRVQPNAILLDAMMPEIDGFETCRRLKSGPDPVAAPIIFMTGLSDPSHIVAGLRAGGVDYVTKPVNTEELIARVAIHIANARLIDDTRNAFDAVGQPVMALSPTGAIAWASVQALDIAGRALQIADDGSEIGNAAFLGWVASVWESPTSSVAPWEAAEGRGHVTVTYIGRTTSGDVLVRVSRGEQADEALFREKLGLTQREAEVLHWIVQGKSNRDIAEILSLNPGTVNKHLEKILDKFGVENRTAAAVQALRALGTR